MLGDIISSTLYVALKDMFLISHGGIELLELLNKTFQFVPHNFCYLIDINMKLLILSIPSPETAVQSDHFSIQVRINNDRLN